ncbi:MAG: biliverdin-producing heme oxygenase [Alphaproteobacteria bacterium]|nr:biliverdin-producing heme oxygenase [Alphaproteobacteria bacterium]
MRARTRELHDEAENTGFVADLIAGRARRYGYALYLRNLLPTYEAMERGLDSHRADTQFAGIANPLLRRAHRIVADLRAIGGGGWEQSLPILPEAEHYARRAALAGLGDGAALLAHAYVRYMGDLNGGRILRRLAINSLGLEPGALAFFDYPEIPDTRAFATTYRMALDQAGLGLSDPVAVVEEAAEAFRDNIALSRAVASAAGKSGAGG